MTRAYVFLVMKGDDYIPGVLAAVQSIKMTGSKYPAVCMVTRDVSERGRHVLATVCDEVVVVPYLRYATKRMKTDRQMELYGSWMNESYTKWNALKLTRYEKVLFVDADIIVIQNIDHLFDLEAPAATFSTPWAREFDASSTFSVDGYPDAHGSSVSSRNILYSLVTGGYTFIASVVLLEPSTQDYEELLSMLSENAPFGFNNYSTPDEQSLAYFYAVPERRRQWTHIHQKYNFIIYKVDWLRTADNRVTVPHVLHYFSRTKPWLMARSFTRSPWNTDRLWWFVLYNWARSQSTVVRLDIPLFSELDRAELRDFIISETRLDREYFPWLLTLVEKKFPVLMNIGLTT